jgi:hypothetical protein
VRRGDDDARDRAEVADGERDHGCGSRLVHEYRVQPGAADDGGGIAGEHVGLVPRVVTDHDRAVGQAVRLQIGTQAAGGADHHHAVHPVRAGPDRTAQPGRAELELGAEPVRDPSLVPGVEQSPQFGAGVRVRVLSKPTLGGSPQRIGHHGATLASAHHPARQRQTSGHPTKAA